MVQIQRNLPSNADCTIVWKYISEHILWVTSWQTHIQLCRDHMSGAYIIDDKNKTLMGGIEDGGGGGIIVWSKKFLRH